MYDWTKPNPLAPRYTPRTYAPAAQGVCKWYRTLEGREYMFTLVTAGWWGVGETGTLRVYRRISNGDWYVTRTLQLA